MDRTPTASFDLSPLPTETRGRPWIRSVFGTALRLLRAPGTSFVSVPESIVHARVLGFLACFRLPAWGILMVVLGVRWATGSDPTAWRPIAFAQITDLALVEALAAWLLILVPLGIPLIYFSAGLLAHVSLGLTGGARQSIGATMRAFGYTAAPALFVISILDLTLYLGVFEDAARRGFSGPELYATVLAAILVLHFGFFALALARTHRVTLVRAVLTALLPILFFGGVTMGRALLHLERFPFIAAPEPSPYAPISFE